jgi:hypothetical protein
MKYQYKVIHESDEKNLEGGVQPPGAGGLEGRLRRLGLQPEPFCRDFRKRDEIIQAISLRGICFYEGVAHPFLAKGPYSLAVFLKDSYY